MKRQRCDGRVAIVKKEKGHSAMQTIWSGGRHSGQHYPYSFMIDSIYFAKDGLIFHEEE